MGYFLCLMVKQDLSWPGVFWICFGMSAFCAVLVIILNERPLFRKEKPVAKDPTPKKYATDEKQIPNVFVTEEQLMLNDLDGVIPEEGTDTRKVQTVEINTQKAFQIIS